MNTDKRKKAELEADKYDDLIKFSQEVDEYYRSRSSTGENLEREDRGWKEYDEWVTEMWRKSWARKHGVE